MARSDFSWVNFDTNFDAPGESATRTFDVEGNPFGTGYLLVQSLDLDTPQNTSVTPHQIEINGQDLPSFDLPTQEGNNRWTTWMDRIPPGFLQQGTNRITIRRVGADQFFIANVAVHWRELG